jgi:hypothetical protein
LSTKIRRVLVEIVMVVGCIAIAALTLWRILGESILRLVDKQTDEVARIQGECLGGLCLNGACFVAGTPVATPSGWRPIEEVAVGDAILSRSERSGAIVVSRVVRALVTEHQPVVDIGLGGGERIRATPGHLFFTEDRGWVEAKDIASGEALLSANSSDLRAEGVHPVASEATVYNLEVAGTHTYFVGRARAWVHNPTGPCGGRPAGSTKRAILGGGPSADGTFTTGTGQVLADNLAEQAEQLRANIRAQVASLATSDVVIAGVLDTQTGQIYYGTNSAGVPSLLHPALASYAEAAKAGAPPSSDPPAHASIIALNTALNARKDASGRAVGAGELDGFLLDTGWLRGTSDLPGGMKRGEPALLCPTCQSLIPPGVIVLPGYAPLSALPP